LFFVVTCEKANPRPATHGNKTKVKVKRGVEDGRPERGPEKFN
jgi:hypothetical protein